MVNAANEVAVAHFLDDRLRFADIHEVIAATLQRASFVAEPGYDDFVASNAEARALAEEEAAKLFVKY